MRYEIIENNILLNHKINSPSKRGQGEYIKITANSQNFTIIWFKKKNQKMEKGKRREEDAKLYSHLFTYSHPDTRHLL